MTIIDVMSVHLLQLCVLYLTGKLQEARKVLGDAVAVLEKSPTVSSDYCKVSCMTTNI